MEYRDYLVQRELAERTIRGYTRMVIRAQTWAVSHGLDLLTMTPSQVREMGEAWPYTAESRRQLRVALRHYWQMHGLPTLDPSIRCPKRKRGGYRGIPDADAERLLEVGWTDWPRGAATVIGLFQGIRRENIARLRWDEFNQDMTVLEIMMKGGRPHRMPVHPFVRQVLEPHRWPGEWVFPGRFGGHVSLTTINNWIEAMVELAGVPRFTPHQMRHTSAGVVFRATSSYEVTGAWLGHADLSTTRRYTEVTDQMLRVALDAFDIWQTPNAA